MLLHSQNRLNQIRKFSSSSAALSNNFRFESEINGEHLVCVVVQGEEKKMEEEMKKKKKNLLVVVVVVVVASVKNLLSLLLYLLQP